MKRTSSGVRTKERPGWEGNAERESTHARVAGPEDLVLVEEDLIEDARFGGVDAEQSVGNWARPSLLHGIGTGADASGTRLDAEEVAEEHAHEVPVQIATRWDPTIFEVCTRGV